MLNIISLTEDRPLKLFILFSILCSLVGILTETYMLIGFPAAILFSILCVYNLKLVYYLLFLSIPLSTEYYFSFGFGTDLFSEQIMWALTACGLLLFILYGRLINAAYFLNPISLLLISIFCWVAITSLTAQNMFISIKYLLAKVWYLVALFAMPLYFLRDMKDIEKALRVFMIFFVFTVVVVFIRHLGFGLTFDSSNKVLDPFYRNHVNYACLIAVSFPYVLWYAYNRENKNTKHWLYALCFFLAIALYFSFTRAAIGALILVLPFYLIVRWRLTKLAIIGALTAAFFLAAYIVEEDRYLELAPNFESTISHTEFDNLISATVKLEDISTMERVYRWVAGYHMIKDKPLVGFGPSNFYENYSKYTVKSFTTYVSENPEKSGIHNYYLLLMVEQGIPGFLFFVALLYFALTLGQRFYSTLENQKERTLILAAMSSIFVVVVISLMNDMIETDKVGFFFFLSLALISRTWIKEKSK